MQGNNDISHELRMLSELVASISRGTPYRVADDYFHDLSARVLVRVKTQHKPLAFNAPGGYFEGFAQSVLARIKAGAGKDSGGVSDRDREEGTPIPVDAELAMLSPFLAGIKRETGPTAPYRMPVGYMEEVSPLLTVVSNRNPYSVPEDYFHNLPAEIVEKITEPEVERAPAKVVTLGRRRMNWLKYSVAAAVAGLILTVGWLRLHVPGGGPKGSSPEVVAALPKVSDQELKSFLADQDTTLAQPASSLTTLDFGEGDLKTLLGDVSDGELRQYMEEHGGANDLATN